MAHCGYAICPLAPSPSGALLASWRHRLAHSPRLRAAGGLRGRPASVCAGRRARLPLKSPGVSRRGSWTTGISSSGYDVNGVRRPVEPTRCAKRPSAPQRRRWRGKPRCWRVSGQRWFERTQRGRSSSGSAAPLARAAMPLPGLSPAAATCHRCAVSLHSSRPRPTCMSAPRVACMRMGDPCPTDPFKTSKSPPRVWVKRLKQLPALWALTGELREGTRCPAHSRSGSGLGLA